MRPSLTRRAKITRIVARVFVLRFVTVCDASVTVKLRFATLMNSRISCVRFRSRFSARLMADDYRS
jgi:hypothetical protein